MAEAFALREDHTGDVTYVDEAGVERSTSRFRGATFALADGSTFDVGEHLDAGDGVIATEDPALIALLRAVPALKRVGHEEGAPLVVAYENQPVAALREHRAAKEIVGAHRMRRDELVARLQMADRGEDPNAPLETPVDVDMSAPQSQPEAQS